MSTFIQNYKNWKQARKIVKQEKECLDVIRESITANCDADLFSDNLAKMRMFIQEVRDSGNNPDVISNGAKKYRAVSCFYKWVYDIGRVYNGTSYVSDYVDVLGAVPCINVDKDGCSYDEARCEGCPHFSGLIEYQAQKAQVQKAIENCKATKQELFSCFYEQSEK